MFGLLGGISGKIIVIQLVVMLVILGGGYFYYKSTQSRLEHLAAEKAQLQTALTLQEQTINTLQQTAQRQAAEVVALQHSLGTAETTRRELEARLRRYDIQARARVNSAQTEADLNRATATMFRDIETLTTPRDRPVSAPSAAPATTPAQPGTQPPPRPPAPRTQP